MKNRNKYFAPEIATIDIGNLLETQGESNWGITGQGEGGGKEGGGIIDGNPSFILAKPHTLWDDGDLDSSSDWDSPWK